jgi:hypothetical protein
LFVNELAIFEEDNLESDLPMLDILSHKFKRGFGIL